MPTAAGLLDVSDDTVRRWCDMGDVFPNAYPIGTQGRRYWRIPVNDLRRIRPSLKVGATAGEPA